MSSTDLQVAETPTAQPPPQTETEKDEATLRKGFDRREGVRRLGHLLATKSIGRNLETEDAVFDQEMFGGSGSGRRPRGEDMEVTAAGDVTVNNIHQAPPQKANGIADLAKKAAIAASLLGLGAAGPLIAQYFASKPTTTVVNPVTPGAAFDLLPADVGPTQ